MVAMSITFVVENLNRILAFITVSENNIGAPKMREKNVLLKLFIFSFGIARINFLLLPLVKSDNYMESNTEKKP